MRTPSKVDVDTLIWDDGNHTHAFVQARGASWVEGMGAYEPTYTLLVTTESVTLRFCEKGLVESTPVVIRGITGYMPKVDPQTPDELSELVITLNRQERITEEVVEIHYSRPRPHAVKPRSFKVRWINV